MTFEEIIRQTPDVATGYMSGLGALKRSDRPKINVSDNRLLGGSVNIDGCTVGRYPEDNRWDYVFDYNDRFFFVEVHPANTSEVRVVLNKLAWLENWLRTQAPLLDKRQAKTYHWIQSGRFDIPKSSREFRLVSEKGLKPKPRLQL